mmetsp:Transcript_19342/g.50388  ORF Transcript_19342/g.50388 Transcript_19342/m.50388 type:complete len:278 (+) Transcript_19342:202-1035(+)
MEILEMMRSSKKTLTIFQNTANTRGARTMNVLRWRSGCSTLSAAAQRLKMRTSPRCLRPKPSQSITKTPPWATTHSSADDRRSPSRRARSMNASFCITIFCSNLSRPISRWMPVRSIRPNPTKVIGTPLRHVPNSSKGNTVPIQRCQAGAVAGSSHQRLSAPPKLASSSIQSGWSRRHAIASRKRLARSLSVLRARTNLKSSPVSSHRDGCSPSSALSSSAAASSSEDGTSRSTLLSDTSTDRAAINASSSSGDHCKSASSPDAVRTRLSALSKRGR